MPKALGNMDVKGRKALVERLDEKGLFYARKSVERFSWENSYRRLMKVYSLYL